MQKVANLTGGLLDYGVARAVGAEGARLNTPDGYYDQFKRKNITPEQWCNCTRPDWVPEHRWFGRFKPSTDWEQGGPLVDKRCIDIDQDGARSPDVKCRAVMTSFSKDVLQRRVSSFGPTALIAAMRAIVAAKFGEEVDEVAV
jgi:Protein of unknown function (DUF2591)